MSIKLYSCYLRRGIVYIPTVARVRNSGHRDIEPVAVVPISHVEELRRAFVDTIARGNPEIPLATGDKRPSPILPKYAGVTTWSAFARGTMTWGIKEKSGVYQIVGYRRYPSGGWVEDPDQTITLPSGSSVGDAVERMIGILQAATRR